MSEPKLSVSLTKSYHYVGNGLGWSDYPNPDIQLDSWKMKGRCSTLMGALDWDKDGYVDAINCFYEYYILRDPSQMETLQKFVGNRIPTVYGKAATQYELDFAQSKFDKGLIAASRRFDEAKAFFETAEPGTHFESTDGEVDLSVAGLAELQALLPSRSLFCECSLSTLQKFLPFQEFPFF